MGTNKFEISPIKDELRNLFFISSDLELEAHTALYFHLDTSNNKKLEVQNKELYDAMVSGRFLEDFKDDFREKIDLFNRLFEIEENKENLLKNFSKLYIDYLNQLSRNRSEMNITFSKPYVREVKRLLTELNLKLEKYIAIKLTDNLLNKVYHKDFYTLESNVHFSDLRESLINKNLINASEVKIKTLENLFKDVKYKRKLNWIGGKNKLWCFVKIMKDEKKISDKYIHKIASMAFLVDGKEFDKLNKPNKKDKVNYYDKIEKMVRNHFS